MAANDLLTYCDLTQLALSQYLKVLRDGGIVKCRKRSQNRFYSVSNPIIADLITLLSKKYSEGCLLN